MRADPARQCVQIAGAVRRGWVVPWAPCVVKVYKNDTIILLRFILIIFQKPIAKSRLILYNYIIKINLENEQNQN